MVDGPNTYGFCGGDPVNRSDPMGTDWWVVDDQGQPLAGPFEATSKGRDAAYSAAAHLKGIGFGSYAKARVAYYLPEEEAELVTLDGGRQVTRRENFMALADQATSALSDPWRLKVMYEMSTGSNLDDEFLGAVAACIVDQFERGKGLVPYVDGARYALEKVGEWVEPYEEEMVMAQAYCMQLPPGWNATVLFPLAGRGMMRLVIVGGKLVSASRTVIGATALKGAAAFRTGLSAASKAYGFLKANVKIEGTAMVLPNIRLGAQGGKGLPIALGIKEHLYKFAEATKSFHYRQWMDMKLSSVDAVSATKFEQAFREAVENSGQVNFTLQGMWTLARLGAE